MPRPRIYRKINCRLNVYYFKPQGIPLIFLDVVKLNLDEVEALRLKHILNLTQIESAKKMGISQPTFQRILNSTYKKIAEAIIKGKAIEIAKENKK